MEFFLSSSLSSKLAICLVCMGCDLPITYTTHLATSQHPKRIVPLAVDVNFTPEEHQQLQLALDTWNMALNNEMRLDVVDDHFNMDVSEIQDIYKSNGVMLLKVSALGPVMKNADVGAVAQTSHIGVDGHEIYFIQEKTQYRLFEVALHEIGHSLGAYHRSTGLMKTTFDPMSYRCIDYQTIEQVADYNHLNLEAMNWCKNE